MSIRWSNLVFVLFGLFSARATTGDEFDSLKGEVLSSLWRDPGTQTHATLSFRELEALPTVLHDSRAALILVQTDRGNVAKLLVTPGLHKAPGKRDALVPLVVVERFEVYDADKPGSRLARGRDLALFSGFQFDLDTGQIVPGGLGGDLVFTARGEGDGSIAPLGGARLASLSRPPKLPEPPPDHPSAGKLVRPADYSGRYRLVANGQWSGELELVVDSVGTVTGTFFSDASGSAYPVTGKIDADASHKIAFTIAFPRARQDYQGILWSAGKNVLAGTLTMLGREFSFVAARDGTRLDLERGTEVMAGQPAEDTATWVRVWVDPAPDRYRFAHEASPKTGAELTEFLARASHAQNRIKVLVAAGGATPQVRVREAIEAVQAAGITAIHLAPAVEDP
jgi:hypothetical protein